MRLPKAVAAIGLGAAIWSGAISQGPVTPGPPPDLTSDVAEQLSGAVGRRDELSEASEGDLQNPTSSNLPQDPFTGNLGPSATEPSAIGQTPGASLDVPDSAAMATAVETELDQSPRPDVDTDPHTNDALEGVKRDVNGKIPEPKSDIEAVAAEESALSVESIDTDGDGATLTPLPDSTPAGVQLDLIGPEADLPESADNNGIAEAGEGRLPTDAESGLQEPDSGSDAPMNVSSESAVPAFVQESTQPAQDPGLAPEPLQAPETAAAPAPAEDPDTDDPEPSM